MMHFCELLLLLLNLFNNQTLDKEFGPKNVFPMWLFLVRVKKCGIHFLVRVPWAIYACNAR